MAVLKDRSTRSVSYTVMSRQKETTAGVVAGTALYLHEEDGYPCWTRQMPRFTTYLDRESALVDARQHSEGPWYHKVDPKHLTVVELVKVQHDTATEV